MAPFALLLMLAWSATAAGQRAVMELYGSGSTLCTLEMTQLCYRMSSTAKPPVYSAYRAIGTGSGRDEFLQGLTNLTTRPAYTMLGMHLPADNYTAAQAAGGIITVPTMVAKIGFFHSVRTANGSAQAVYLTSCLLAQIYSRTITVWSDPAIKALNPNLAVAAGTPITVLRRKSLFSPSQQAVVSFLWSKCSVDNGGPWSGGNMAAAVPWDPATVPMSEDQDMLAALSTPWNQAGYCANAIGFIDTALGLLPQYSLMEVSVQWIPGGPFTSGGQAGAGQPNQLSALLNNTSWPALDADWSTFSLTPVIQANPTLWPVLVTPLFIALKNATWLGASWGLLMAALNMLLSDTMQVSIAANGHIPLLPAVRSSLVTQAAALIQFDPSSPQWTFERDQSVMTGTGAMDYVFSEFRVSGLTLAVENNDAASGNIAMINTQLVQVWSNLSIAQTVRSQLQEALANNAENQHLINKATQIATAGVVLSVLLAFVALVLAAVHVCKLKQVDAKYAKYISLGKFTMAKPAAQDDAF